MEKAIRVIQTIVRKSVSLFVILATLSPLVAEAAILSLSPSSGSHASGASFSVGIYVASPDQAMNAVSATIAFPTDTLQVVSVSKSGSIVDFWAAEPSFSNTTGEIRLEGVVLTPGYKGPAGKLISVTFKGKQAGTAKMSITRSSVLANDGVGTEILTSVTGASFSITKEDAPEPDIIKLDDLVPTEDTDTKEAACVPDSIITSSTHPGIVWRRENTAAFSWAIEDGILASRIAFDRNPSTEPTAVQSPALAEKRYENIEDGIWYFHLALQDNSGWQKTEHFKIKIDHTPPTIEATQRKRPDLTDPRPVIDLRLTDQMSCIKNFELTLNGRSLNHERQADGSLRLATIEPGQHELAITAYDVAGNMNQSFLDIVVEALETPAVIEYPAAIEAGEMLVIKGETIQNGNIEARITNKKNNFLLRREFQSGSGRFTLEEAGLPKGTVFISFRVTDGRGAQSQWSHPIEVKVQGGGIDLRSLESSLGIEVLAGLGLLLVLGIVLVTRALTIRRIRKDLGL